MSEKVKKKKLTLLDRVEKVGNALPHPATIFLILSAVIVVLSAILSAAGVSVTYEGINRTTNTVEEMTVTVQSLLSREGVQYLFKSADNKLHRVCPTWNSISCFTWGWTC